MSSDKNPKYIAVLDFEATCDDGTEASWSPAKQEIIEFPVALVDVEKRQIVAFFHSMVRPTLQPKLTAFCTTLTTIEQKEVDGQPTIDTVWIRFNEWIKKHQLTEDNCYILTCGDWDLQKMWSKQIVLSPTISPTRLFQRWINIKDIFRQQEGFRAPGMMGMLAYADIPHTGIHHRGIDDVRNIVQLVFWLLSKGAVFNLTWTDEQRAREFEIYEKRCMKKERAIKHLRSELNKLSVGNTEAKNQKAKQLESFNTELSFLRKRQAVFACLHK